MPSDGQVVFEVVLDDKKVKKSVKDVTKDIEKETNKWDKSAKTASDGMAKSVKKAGDNVKKAVKETTREVNDEIEKSTKEAERDVDESSRKMGDSLSSSFGKAAAGAATVLAAVAAVAIKIGKEAVEAASDLQEVQNVVDVTFGDSSKAVDKWAKEAGKNFGLTETAAKRYASTIGAMLKSQGVSGSDVLTVSENIAGLAADMASFYNLDFDTAFEKLRSGISGETEPLKQLGINMSAANLEAFRMEQGITKSYNAMSQSEQTLLRYKYLMKATADAQGDFARTSDSFANATRRISTSWETIKTIGGGFLLEVIDPITAGLAELLEKLSTRPDTTVLDDFDQIEADTAKQMGQLQQTYNKATDLVGVLKEIERMTARANNGSVVSLTSLFEEIRKVESSGGDARSYLEKLGYDADYVYQKYQVWDEAVRQLTSSIPGLTSVIDSETGAIQGGTAAIDANVKAWRDGEEQKLAWAAYYAKERALIEKKQELYSYELDADAAKQKVNRLRENLISTYDWVTESAFGDNNLITPEFARQNGSRFVGDVIWAFEEYKTAVDDLNTANAEYTVQAEAFADADQQLADAKQSLIDKYGDEKQAAADTGKTVQKYMGRTEAEWENLTTAVKESITAMADYAQGVHDATAQAVNSVVNGFKAITRPTTEMEEKRSRLIEQQNALNRSTKDGEKRYQELQKQIDELNHSMEEYTPAGMKNALQSQLAFMEEYINNLEQARKMGLSDDLLAYLSDGSVQSAEYLSQLVANPEQAAEIDALYAQVKKKKDELTNALTDQKLTVDDVYNSLAEKAKQAIADMNLQGEAEAALADTVQGIADGINDKQGEVQKAVDAILEQLNRLRGFGINFSTGTSFNAGLLKTTGKLFDLDGSHANGLDYVPFDNYLASLHEGEAILTSEENRIWQRFKNGAQPQTMDYDALGATMRENVKAGGNVYLDGRTVGRVISAQQGNDFRALKRSGWQG
jgi:gas vesicle protein